MDGMINDSKSLSGKARENLDMIRRVRETRLMLRSEQEVKQYSRDEIIEFSKIILSKDNHVYSMFNIGLPTKPWLQGKDRALSAPWFRHEDNGKPIDYSKGYPEYTFKRTKTYC